MSWLTEMTQIRRIDNSLYFKGKISDKHIRLNAVYGKKTNEKDVMILLSIIK